MPSFQVKDSYLFGQPRSLTHGRTIVPQHLICKDTPLQPKISNIWSTDPVALSNTPCLDMSKHRFWFENSYWASHSHSNISVCFKVELQNQIKHECDFLLSSRGAKMFKFCYDKILGHHSSITQYNKSSSIFIDQLVPCLLELNS